MKFLVIPKEGVSPNWYEGFPFEALAVSPADKFPIPRIHVEIKSYEQRLALESHPLVQTAEAIRPFTKQEISRFVLDLYHEGNEQAERLADSIVDLLAMPLPKTVEPEGW